MSHSQNTDAKRWVAVRFFRVLLTLLLLNVPHGLPDGPTVQSGAMVADATQSHHGSGDTGRNHNQISAQLCLTICLGADRLADASEGAQVQRVNVVPWFADVDPVLDLPTPHPALRPPTRPYSI